MRGKSLFTFVLIHITRTTTFIFEFIARSTKTSANAKENATKSIFYAILRQSLTTASSFPSSEAIEKKRKKRTRKKNLYSDESESTALLPQSQVVGRDQQPFGYFGCFGRITNRDTEN